ncbi:MAG: ABC transporter permease [Acidobacteriota bacterium]
MISLQWQRRLNVSKWAGLFVPLLAVLMSLLLGAIFLYFYGFDPAEVYSEMFGGAFGSAYGISETLVKGIPLMLCALAVSLAFRMQLWNIGAEGQLYMGAFASGGIALYLGHLSTWLVLPLMLICAIIAGGLWGFIPGFLKARWRVNETLTSLMLNYVAIFWVDYLIFGPWKDPNGRNFPLTAFFPESASLPTLGDTRVHAGLILAIIVAVALWYVLRYSRWGYEVRVMGESLEAARYSGMNNLRNIMLVMAISGAVAGIAGMVETSGVTHRVQQGLSPGYGYTGIIVAWLGRLHPFIIIIISFLFGGLLTGGYSVQTIGIPFSITQMLQGFLLFFLLGGEIFITHSVKIVRRRAN